MHLEIFTPGAALPDIVAYVREHVTPRPFQVSHDQRD